MNQASNQASAQTTGKPAVTCTGIDHVVLYVRDLARSVAFYSDILGMEVKSQSAGHAFLRCGGQLFGLFPADGDKDMGAGDQVSHVAFSVATGTTEEIRKALAERGVTPRGRRGDPDCIYFDDPDGYTVQIVSLAE